MARKALRPPQALGGDSASLVASATASRAEPFEPPRTRVSPQRPDPLLPRQTRPGPRPARPDPERVHRQQLRRTSCTVWRSLRRSHVRLSRLDGRLHVMQGMQLKRCRHCVASSSRAPCRSRPTTSGRNASRGVADHLTNTAGSSVGYAKPTRTPTHVGTLTNREGRACAGAKEGWQGKGQAVVSNTRRPCGM